MLNITAVTGPRLSLVVSILDGHFGSEMEVVAVKEGLELDGYSVIPWEWIDSVRQVVSPSTESAQSPYPECGTSFDERATKQSQ